MLAYAPPVTIPGVPVQADPAPADESKLHQREHTLLSSHNPHLCAKAKNEGVGYLKLLYDIVALKHKSGPASIILAPK